MKAEIIREGSFLLVRKNGPYKKVQKVIVEKRKTRRYQAPVVVDYARSLKGGQVYRP
jgi:hypothetical protein